MGDYISDAEIIEDRGTESMTRRPSVEEGMMLAAISVQAILLCFLLTAEVSSGIPLTSTTEPRENNGSLIPKDDDSWHKYVRAPPSKNIAPQSIVLESITGKVINPQGMISGTGPTTFTRSNEDDIRPSLIVDFGQNVVGYLTLKLRGTKLDQSTTALPGLRIAFSETLQNLASGRSDFTRSDNADTGDTANKLVFNGTDQIAVESREYIWTDKLGCQEGDKVCADGLHGFRYVMIMLEALPSDAPYTTSFGSVDISSIWMTYSGFLGTPDTFTGWFECSDEELTQWWYDGVYTNDLCTAVFRAEDVDPRQAFTPSLDGKVVLHDGAKRDRDPYVGDLAVSALTSYLSHDMHEAARNVLADLADHQRADGWIPPASIRDYTLPLFDYPLWWIVCSYNLVLYTGDIDYLSKYYPVLVKTLDTFYLSVTDPATALIVKGLHGTGSYGDYAFLPRHGPVTYYNALHVLALTHAAFLADTLNHPSDSARWQSRATAVARSLLSRNWDSSSGAFFDGSPCPNSSSDSAICPTHPQDGNALSILAGLVAPQAAESVLAHLSSSASLPYGNAFFDNDLLLSSDPSSVPLQDRFSTRVYPFVSFFEISARLESPRDEIVESGWDQLRRTYRHMARSDPGVTTWEGIGAGGEPYEGGFTSMAHGWSTGTVPLLTGYLLGVRPTGVGFERWVVRPVGRAGVEWCRGAVPTPRGVIRVWWEEGGENGFEMGIDAPEDTVGVVWVPVPWERAGVSVDGVMAYDGREEGSGEKGKMYGARYESGYVVLEIGGGSYAFTVEG